MSIMTIIYHDYHLSLLSSIITITIIIHCINLHVLTFFSLVTEFAIFLYSMCHMGLTGQSSSSSSSSTKPTKKSRSSSSTTTTTTTYDTAVLHVLLDIAAILIDRLSTTKKASDRKRIATKFAKVFASHPPDDLWQYCDSSTGRAALLCVARHAPVKYIEKIRAASVKAVIENVANQSAPIGKNQGKNVIGQSGGSQGWNQGGLVASLAAWGEMDRVMECVVERLAASPLVENGGNDGKKKKKSKSVESAPQENTATLASIQKGTSALDLLDVVMSGAASRAIFLSNGAAAWREQIEALLMTSSEFASKVSRGQVAVESGGERALAVFAGRAVVANCKLNVHVAGKGREEEDPDQLKGLVDLLGVELPQAAEQNQQNQQNQGQIQGEKRSRKRKTADSPPSTWLLGIADTCAAMAVDYVSLGYASESLRGSLIDAITSCVTVCDAETSLAMLTSASRLAYQCIERGDSWRRVSPLLTSALKAIARHAANEGAASVMARHVRPALIRAAEAAKLAYELGDMEKEMTSAVDGEKTDAADVIGRVVADVMKAQTVVKAF